MQPNSISRIDSHMHDEVHDEQDGQDDGDQDRKDDGDNNVDNLKEAVVTKTEHYNTNRIYIIKVKSNEKLIRVFATSSGVARALALSRGANSLRKRSKLGVSSEDPDPTLYRALVFSHPSRDLNIEGASSDTLPASSDELFVVADTKRSAIHSPVARRAQALRCGGGSSRLRLIWLHQLAPSVGKYRRKNSKCHRRGRERRVTLERQAARKV
ncbi:ferredoxin-5, chloroplastic-like [Dorcoceras hygrometricum]|uniref:Ferredoxin-5, chloroplastic-like n=1 Tax=Dorcoceras hygrometricum TaxID=472368 RepID=A0A2Z7CZI2_9LAMI|nr:ferredoxin-5, chloroplastic-like [Dorcoceras hygrometricum]